MSYLYIFFLFRFLFLSRLHISHSFLLLSKYICTRLFIHSLGFFEVIRIKIGCVNTRTKNREHISNYKKRSRNKTLTETLKLDWIMFFRIKHILFRLLLIHQNRKIHMKGIKSSKSDFFNTLFLF
jgi:hypothetical protein